jgi:hypothetical protein
MKSKSSYGQGVFKILFKEVLEEMPPDLADKMIEGYQGGRIINLILGQGRGINYKTAYSIGLTDSQNGGISETEAA